MENKNVQTLAKDKNEFVSSIITNKKGNILVLKRRDDLRLDPGKYDFCSGHMKEGEAPMQAMFRELIEEIGLRFDQISYMDKIGVIDTPHEKLEDTVTHLYHIEINISEEELNKMIKNVEEPEMEEAIFLENIEALRKMQTETKDLRTAYTRKMQIVLEVMEKRINKRIEKGEKGCEEK